MNVPPAPNFSNESGTALHPGQISSENYMRLAAKFKALAQRPPPAERLHVTSGAELSIAAAPVLARRRNHEMRDVGGDLAEGVYRDLLGYQEIVVGLAMGGRHAVYPRPDARVNSVSERQPDGWHICAATESFGDTVASR